jgi:tetratricopeptide (TPR) repeat protein
MGFQSATALLQAGQWERGAEELRAALVHAPQEAGGWSNLGFALRQLGRFGQAREALERALAIDPGLADAWNLLGLVEQDELHHERARDAFGRALALRPGFAYAHMNLGNSELALGRREAALASYARALQLDPGHAEIHYNLGRLNDEAGALEESERNYQEALRLNPRHSMARHNRAHVLMRLENAEEAIAELREAVRLDPQFMRGRVQLGHALFLSGHFDEAWTQAQWREPRNLHASQRVAAGGAYEVPSRDALAGARLNVIGEQGLGDTLFYLRFAPAVRALGASLRFAGDPRLHALLARTGLFEHVAATTSQLREPGALEILAGDLPLFSPAPLAPPLALVVDPVQRAAMASRLAALGPAPHIAIAWRAGIPHAGTFTTLYKEVPVAALGEALRGVRATWVSVQRDPRQGETEALASALGARVHDLSAVNSDLEMAFAAMALVDDYVGVSNTNVHLRASAGRSSRVLVPFPPEWRWMMRGDSPWFEGSRVYRQQRGGDWLAALGRLSRDL